MFSWGNTCELRSEKSSFATMLHFEEHVDRRMSTVLSGIISETKIAARRETNISPNYISRLEWGLILNVTCRSHPITQYQKIISRKVLLFFDNADRKIKFSQ